MKQCKGCRRYLTETQPQAMCSCGDTYCAECVSIFTPAEFREAIADSEIQGHHMTLLGIAPPSVRN